LCRELLLLLLLLLLLCSLYKFPVTADISAPGCQAHSGLGNYKLAALQVTLSTLLQSVDKMQFLGAFAKLWIATISFIISVRPSVAQLSSMRRIFMKFLPGIFTELSRKLTFD
jgi:hypothetical protein